MSIVLLVNGLLVNGQGTTAVTKGQYVSCAADAVAGVIDFENGRFRACLLRITVSGVCSKFTAESCARVFACCCS
jgi:hypothetical protein